MITQICVAGEGASHPDSVHQCHVSWNWNPVWEIVHQQCYKNILPKNVGHEDVMNHLYAISILPLTLDSLYLISIRCLCTDKHFIRIASKSENRLGFGLMVLPPVIYPTLLQHASYHWNISCYISKIIPTKAYMDPLDDHGLFDFLFSDHVAGAQPRPDRWGKEPKDSVGHVLQN